MKPIKTFGLATLIALTTMAIGAPSSMAESTALCNADPGNGSIANCLSGHLVTHVHEASVVKITILSSLNVQCDVLFLGDALSPLASPLVIHGAFTYTNCGGGCIVEEQNGPAEVKVLKEGHETAKVTLEFLLHVECQGFIECNFNGVGLVGAGKGPLLSTQTNGEVAFSNQTLTKEVSFLCPKTNKLDFVTSPLSATYITN